MYNPPRFNAGPYARFHARLLRAGRSVTQPRDVVFGAFIRLGPCTMKALVAELVGRIPAMTVYRTVRLFRELGVVDMIRQDVIELRPPFKQHVHYLVCEQCGRQVGFNDEQLERQLERLAAGRRWAMSYHRVELVGQCGVCRGLS
jgi:Fe2+ or Zn2+ uptake regulation protein